MRGGRPLDKPNRPLARVRIIYKSLDSIAPESTARGEFADRVYVITVEDAWVQWTPPEFDGSRIAGA